MSYEAPTLTPEATKFLTDFDRLKVECPVGVEYMQSRLQDVPLNILSQVVPFLSKVNKPDLLDEISAELEASVRALNTLDTKPTEAEPIAQAAIANISAIWARRRD